MAKQGSIGTSGAPYPMSQQANPPAKSVGKSAKNTNATSFSPVSSFTPAEQNDFKQLLGELKQKDNKGSQREIGQLLKAGVPPDKLISALMAKGISVQDAVQQVLTALQASGALSSQPSAAGSSGGIPQSSTGPGFTAEEQTD